MGPFKEIEAGFHRLSARIHDKLSKSRVYNKMAEKYDKMPLWQKITSGVVITALMTGCAQKTFGYVTPPAEGTQSPTTDPAYCDSHMLTFNPEPAPDIDFQNLEIVSERPMGPSGVGTVTELSRVQNPDPGFIDNVRDSITEEGLDIDPKTATIVEFGMRGTEGDLCSPLVLVLDEVQDNGTQRSFIGFGNEQADTNGDNVPDLDVLVPPYDGNVSEFLEMGQVVGNPPDGLVRLGPFDQLDPSAIIPLFTIDRDTGEVAFLPPFSDAGSPSLPDPIRIENAGTISQISYRPGQRVATATPDAAITAPPTVTPRPTETATPAPTETPEVAQFQVCQIESFRNCPIPAEALFDGSYKAWLESLPPTQFDPATVNDVPLVHFSNGAVYYEAYGSPHFTGANAGREPFNRNRTFGYTEYAGQKYIVMPIEYWDRDHPDKNQWVITVVNISEATDAMIQNAITQWKSWSVTPWVDSASTRLNPGPDPFVSTTLAKYPNLVDLVERFVDYGNVRHDGKGDRTALNLPGIILLSYITDDDTARYK
jgi:hypothetical protein